MKRRLQYRFNSREERLTGIISRQTCPYNLRVQMRSLVSATSASCRDEMFGDMRQHQAVTSSYPHFQHISLAACIRWVVHHTTRIHHFQSTPRPQHGSSSRIQRPQPPSPAHQFLRKVPSPTLRHALHRRHTTNNKPENSKRRQQKDRRSATRDTRLKNHSHDHARINISVHSSNSSSCSRGFKITTPSSLDISRCNPDISIRTVLHAHLTTPRP